MAERPIKRFVDVEIRKGTPSVSAAGFGILMAITDSDLLTVSRRARTFTTPESVALFFGTISEEALYADAFFNQDPFLEDQPDQLVFGRFADDAIAAVLECGDSPESDIEVWKLVTDGEFAVTVDAVLDEVAGLNFSAATSLDDVATIITAGLTGSTCTYLINRFAVTSDTTGAASLITLLDTVGTPAGTDISGALYLDGAIIESPTNLGGSILSQGQIAETFATALLAIEAKNSDWYAMGALKKFRDDTITENMADEIESRRKMFLIATNDANTLVSGSTSTYMHYLKNANYKRSGGIYHDNDTLYPDASWMGQQLPKDIGSTNWAYKTLAGIAEGAKVDIPIVSLTEDEKNNALSVNCNLYSSVLGADFTYFGTMGGGKNVDKEGEYIDIIRNIDFLQARVEEGLMALLLEKDIIPFTNGGITIVDNRLISRLDQYGVKQGILIDGTVETFFPKRSEVSQADRDDRLLPGGTFTAELAGGINTVIVRGTVSI